MAHLRNQLGTKSLFCLGVLIFLTRTWVAGFVTDYWLYIYLSTSAAAMLFCEGLNVPNKVWDYVISSFASLILYDIIERSFGNYYTFEIGDILTLLYIGVRLYFKNRKWNKE